MKPRLLYFTPGHKYKEIVVPNNHEPMIDRLERWLDHYFDVIRVTDDCDLKVEVERYRPNMILFDALLEGTAKLRLHITSLDAYPEIPRAGFSRVDALSPTRGNAFEELQMKGAEAIFVLAEPYMGEQMPDFKDSIIHVPWFIDAEVFKDWGEPKRIPVGMFGTFEGPPYMYPWRASVKKLLLENLPALYFRHPGYNLEAQKNNPLVLFGESYARTLNSCMVIPSCGCFTEIVVSKQIEIPASRALLVTPGTDAMIAHGFRHGVNCLFADQYDIVEQIREVLEDRKKLERITDEGFRFVHSTHTLKQRPQMLQWYELRKDLKPGQRIVQTGLFGEFKVVEQDSPERTFHMTNNPMQRMLKEADTHIQNGDFYSADRACKRLLGHCGYLSDPAIRMCLMHLLSGNPHDAVVQMQKPIVNRFHMGAQTPDPIEWGIFLLTLAVTDQHQQLAEYLARFPEVHRRELDLCRWALGVVLGEPNLERESIYALEEKTPQMFSIHNFRNYLFPNLVEGIEYIFQKCGKPQWKDTMRRSLSRERVLPFAV